MGNRLYILLIFAALLSSCGEYEKLLKSTDFELKKEMALQYYEEERFTRTSELMGQILPRYRATEESENLNWINCNTYYGMRDYMMAGAAFRNFAESFPYSEHAEEATFMTAYCDYMLSPRPELDQSYTLSAIEAFTYFKKRYPTSDKLDEVDQLIKQMEEKLVEKSYISARLYYDTKKYKSAIVALGNSLKEYPETKYREEMTFLKLESSYLYASLSVADKQQERFQDTLNEYYSFVEEFPETKYQKDVEKIYNTISKYLNLDETQE